MQHRYQCLPTSAQIINSSNIPGVFNDDSMFQCLASWYDSTNANSHLRLPWTPTWPGTNMNLTLRIIELCIVSSHCLCSKSLCTFRIMVMEMLIRHAWVQSCGFSQLAKCSCHCHDLHCHAASRARKCPAGFLNFLLPVGWMIRDSVDNARQIHLCRSPQLCCWSYPWSGHSPPHWPHQGSALYNLCWE